MKNYDIIFLIFLEQSFGLQDKFYCIFGLSDTLKGGVFFDFRRLFQNFFCFKTIIIEIIVIFVMAK